MKTKTEPIKLKVGDRVRWGSQAGGYHMVKEGTVKIVVPPDIRPYNLLASMDLHNLRTHAIDPRTMARKTESYIIEVSGKGKAMGQLYWPLVSKLEKID